MKFSIEDNLYSHFKLLYNYSPQAIKSIFGRLYSTLPNNLKYGKIHTDFLSLLEKSQWWSKNKIEEYQWQKVKNILSHSYKNVPYYRNLFDEMAINLNNIQNFNDFKIIPFLTKDIIIKNFNKLLAKNVHNINKLLVSTGGSTGNPLKLYYQKGISRAFENAFTIQGWKRLGYNIGDKLAVLRGDIVPNNSRNKNFYFDPIKNRIVLSSYRMTEDNMSDYIHIIRKFKPKFLHVYPSSLTNLAHYIIKHRIGKLISLKGIIANSQTLYDWQLELFKEAFNCNVHSWYGLNEFVALAGGCEYSSDFHFFPEYSYVEFRIDRDKKIESNNDDLYEIIGTNFCNYAMPLIRYKTMDFSTEARFSCLCGRHYPLVKKIIGRSQDFFINKTGNLITFTGHNRPIRPITGKVATYQYLQNEPGRIVLKIELTQSVSNGEERRIRKTFHKIWPSFDFEIKYVDHIKRTKNGKFLYLKKNF